MMLNHVTMPAADLAASIAFHEALGFRLIVKNDHYARLELPPHYATLSLELSEVPANGGPSIYFECDDLNKRVAALKRAGLIFDSDPEDKPWLWREAWLRDPAGTRLCLYFAGENRRFPPWRL